MLKIECYQGQLSKEDIQYIFSQYTHLTHIHFVDHGSETIFETHQPPFANIHLRNDGFSISPFNNFPTPDFGQPHKDFPRHTKCKSLSENSKVKEKLMDSQTYSGKKNKNQSKKKSKSGSNSRQNGNGHKFTCKYEIQIENDKDFQVAK